MEAARIRTMALVLATFTLAAGAAAGLPLAPPSADFTWTPEIPRSGEEIAFLSAASDDSGVILLYRWMVEGDDGTHLRLDRATTAAFARPGLYSVTHEVVDATGQTARAIRTVAVANSPPDLSIEAATNPAFRGETIAFSGSATDVDGDEVLGWSWDFGDGASAQGQNAAHAYASLGAYLVTLTARDAAGHAASRAIQVRIVNAPPSVEAYFSPSAPQAGEPVTFSATGADPDDAGATLEYVWSFSDGVGYAGETVVHTFAAAGNYSVTVRARDAEGATSAPFALAVAVGAS